MKLAKVMKKKSMVPGSWCMVLGALCLVLGASTAWAETLPTGSVVGYWRFNADNPGLDSSGNGNDMKAASTFSDTSYDSGASYDGKNGYLSISKQSGKAYANLVKGGFDSSTKSTGFSIVAKFKAHSNWNPSTPWIAGDDIKTMVGYIRDHNWHTICWVLDPSLSKKSYRLNVEPEFDDNNGSSDTGRAETCSDNDTPGHPTMKFPITLTADTATFGGYVYSSSYGFYGAIDDVCILDRRLTKREMTRYRHTAEVYVYSRPSSTPSFTTSGGWSSELAPSSIPGADFIVENGRTITQDSTATFAAKSLTLGRIVDLMSMVDSSKMIATKVGNLTSSGSGTKLTIADLRLNCGTLTGAAGNSLTATMLTVGATKENPFEINVASGTYAVSGAASGDGWIMKTGAGILDLSGLVDVPKLRMTAGSIKTPRLDGYTGGKVLVNTTTPVEFTGTDGLTGPMQIEVENPPTAAGTYTLMTVPSGSAKSNFDNSAQSYGNLVGTLSVDGTALKLTLKLPFPDADKGEVPVLIGQ